ncbi:MAG: autotransporter-associated beta strand repeat-containing protein [Tepidisphaeraceae bacterium]
MHSIQARHERVPAIIAAAVAGLVIVSSSQAETKTWVGVTGGDMSAAANWTPSAVPSTGSGTTAGDTLSWNDAVNYSLTAGASLSGNNGVYLQMLAGQTGSLQIDGSTGTSGLRIMNIDIAAGSGAFTLGNASGTFVVNLGSGNTGFTGNTWTNNSSNAATISSDMQFADGGGVTGRILTLAGTGDWTFNAAYGITVSGGTGTVGLTKNGTGTATFNATAGNFSVGTTINAGTVRANATQALGTGGIFIAGNSGATAKLELNGGISLNNAIAQNGRDATLNSSAASIVNVAGNNTLSGTITLQTGGNYSVIESQAGTLTLSNATAVTTTATGTRGLTFRGAGNFAVSGAIVNGSATTVEILKDGAGTLTLTGTNTYTGPTTITGGTLQVGSGGTTGSIAAGSNIVNNAALVFNRSNTLTQANAISGTGTLTKLGSSTLTLTGANTYTGATNVNAGLLAYSTTASSIGAMNVASGTGLSVKAAAEDASLLTTTSLNIGGSTLIFDFSTLDTTSPLISTGTFTATGTSSISLLNTAGLTTGAHPLIGYTAFAGGGTFSTTTYTIGARGTGTITNNGTNALVLNVVNDVPIWTGADTANWAVGSTGANGNWVLQSAGTATNYISGDQVLFNDTAVGSTSVNISAASVTPLTTTFDNSAKNYTLTGTGSFGIAGSGSLTKTGTGSLTIASTNTYTGATTLDRGTLNLTGTLGATPISIAPDVGNTAVMNSSGTIAFGSTGRVRVGTVAGGLGVLNVTAGTIGGNGAVTVGDGGAGIATQTGGTVNANVGAILGVAAGNAGVLNVTAGNFNATSAAGTGLQVGQAGSGVLNVSGTGVVTLGGTASATGLNLGSTSVSTASGVANLGAVGAGGGTIVTSSVQHSGTAGTGRFNFHGGTLRASSTPDAGGVAGSGNSFMGGLTSAQVWSEGGTVDNNALNITIDQDLVAPTGNGVTGITVAGGGSGYVTAPLVTLTGGGGTGATAVANVSGGQVVGFTITNPGTGYTSSPTVTLTGGTESGTAATVGNITRTANASGGLTFTGSGTTVLSGTNTYTGTTTVNAGTLAISGGTAIADTAAVVVNSPATLSVSGSEAIGSLAGGGNLFIGGSAQTLTVGGANTSTAFAGNITDATNAILTKTGSGTLTLSGYNTYGGVTNVSQGTLSVSNIANNTGTAGTINLGSGSGAGTLLYTGNGEVTSKAIFLSTGAATNGGVLDMSGTGTLQFTAATLGANASQAHTLTLRGSTTGIGQIDSVISDGASTRKTSVVKAGTGTWVLAGANTFTGSTTVQAGTLRTTPAAYAGLLTNAGGVDLQGGTFTLDYVSAASPVTQVKSILTAGYTANFASGQIRSTTLAAGRTLGYGDDGSVVTVRVTLAGDADLDGDVDFNDFLALQANFGTTGTRFDQGNFNYDGVTDFNDFLALQANFGQSISGDTPAVTAAELAQVMAFTSTSAVPEPATLGVWAGVAALGLKRRRNRSLSSSRGA